MKKLSKVLIVASMAILLIVLASCEIISWSSEIPNPTPTTPTTPSPDPEPEPEPKPEHSHTLVYVEGRDATCTDDGVKTHWICSDCGKYFSDGRGYYSLNPNSTVIAALGHNMVRHDELAPTCIEEGNELFYSCSRCNKYFSDEAATTETQLSSVILPKKHDYSNRQEDEFTYWFACKHCGEIKDGSRTTFDPDMPLPDLTVILEYGESKRGYGQSWDIPVPGSEKYTVYVSNKNIIEVVDHYAYAIDNRGAYLHGIGEGTAVISVIGESGETLVNYRFTVVKDDLTYLGEGDLVKSIDIENTDAVVYYDDTLVTYTLKTAASVDKIVLTQIASKWRYDEKGYFYEGIIELEDNPSASSLEGIEVLDTLTINASNLTDKLVDIHYGTRYSATRTVRGDEATWVIKWDLGKTAVKYIRINTYDTAADKMQRSYAHLNITYPVFGEDDFETLIDLYIRSNELTPIFFRSDVLYTGPDVGHVYFADQYVKFIGQTMDFYDAFIDTSIYGRNSVLTILQHGITTRVIQTDSFDFLEEFMGGKRVLCSGEYPTMAFCYPTISLDFRALWAYKHGFDFDKDKLPYEYAILHKASAVIDEIIKEGMTDFEKEMAIYTWLYELGANCDPRLEEHDIPFEDLPVDVQKSSYAVFERYGGDCMSWSGAFYLLCNMADLDCVSVSLQSVGDASNGGPVDNGHLRPNHRANVIKLDDEYYFVEAFWSWQKTSDDDGTYRYFNMTGETAAKLYAWADPEFGGPDTFNYTSYLVDAHTGELLNSKNSK